MLATSNCCTTFRASRFLHGSTTVADVVGMPVWAREPVAGASSALSSHSLIDAPPLFIGELPALQTELPFDGVQELQLPLDLPVVPWGGVNLLLTGRA